MQGRGAGKGEQGSPTIHSPAALSPRNLTGLPHRWASSSSFSPRELRYYCEHPLPSACSPCWSQGNPRPSPQHPGPQPSAWHNYPFPLPGGASRSDSKEFSGDEQETNDSGQHLPSTCTKHLAKPFTCFILFNAHSHLGGVGAVMCLYSEKEIKT